MVLFLNNTYCNDNYAYIYSCLSNYYYFAVFVFIYLGIHIKYSLKNIKIDYLEIKDMIKRPKRIKFKTILFAVLFTFSIIFSIYMSFKPILVGPNFVGDFARHIGGVQQLLNGFLQLHEPPYKGSPGTYPFLVHTSIAFLKKLTNIHVFDAFKMLIFFQAIFIPLAIFVLTLKITKNNWLSLLNILFVVFYGGSKFAWEKRLYYALALQKNNLVKVARITSICFLIVFLYLLYKLKENKSDKFYLYMSGIFLGILGCSYPFTFYFSSLLMILLLIFSIKDKIYAKSIILILLIGGAISLLFYAPLFFTIVKMGGITNPSPSDIKLTLPIRNYLAYGSVGILGLAGTILLI